MLTNRQKQPFNTEGKTETKLDSQERLTKYTAMSGVQYTLTYTGDSRDPATITSAGVRTTYTYDAAGNVDTTTVQPTNGGMYLWSKNYYDETKNFCVMSTGVDGATSERSYDVSTGLLTTSKTPRGQTTAYNYDTNNGRILSTDFCQRNNGFLFYQYANNGQLLQLNRKSFYCGSETRQAYHFTYDAWGNTTKIEVGKAAGDEDNSLSSATQLAQYSYDTAGKMIEMRYPSGQFVTYGYDVLDRLVSEKYYKNASTLEVEYQYIYNANGQLAKQQAVRNGTVTESYSFEYDSLGRLIRSREEGGSGIVQRTEHLYDTANRLTKQSWMLGTKSFSESYSYRKNDGALDHIDTATGDTVSYGYDALKRVNSVTTKNSAGQTLLTQSNTFQSLDSTRTSSRLSTYTVKGANQQTIVGNRYSYDPNGNITKIEEANGSDYRVIAEYVYDWMDQLCKETRYTYSDGSSNPASTTVIEYAADTAGNLRSVKVNGTETLSYTYGDSAWADKLTKITVNGKNKTIQYADALNPGNWYNGTDYTNLTWTQGRRLSSITKGSSTYSYEYDMSGVRSVKIADGWKHEYVTQNGRVVRDKVTNASTGAFQYVLEFGYDESGRPLTLRWYYNEAETWYNAYYYICNAQGDVVKLVSDSGATIAAYSYDAWGTLLSIQGESNGDAFIAYANPLRYRGYYYDTETGFYYLQSRYYDPIVKRFLNADSYGSTGQGFLGYNMFAYCGNNPVNGMDASGTRFVNTMMTDSGGGFIPAPGSARYTPDFVQYWQYYGCSLNVAITAYYDPVNNEDEAIVLESPLPFAFYKGRLVIKTSLIGDNAFSFGVMVIGTGNVNDPAGVGINTIKHEYGHTVQFDEYGILGYIAFIGVPSVLGYIKSTKGPFPDYYNQPCERQADIYGGVTRASHSPSSAAEAAQYRKTTLTIINIFNFGLDILMPN